MINATAMSYIHLTTFIQAPATRVFDLSRSAALHKISMKVYGAEIIAGTSWGLFELNDTVTWSARQLFKKRQLKFQVTRMDKSEYFRGEMVSGDFISLVHDHYFRQIENGTILIDQFRFECPMGRMGRWLDRFYLGDYMKSLLEGHNRLIREYAEGNRWAMLLA